jgi:hypothetical protein
MVMVAGSVQSSIGILNLKFWCDPLCACVRVDRVVTQNSRTCSVGAGLAGAVQNFDTQHEEHSRKGKPV